jgi:hypothetical protein
MDGRLFWWFGRCALRVFGLFALLPPNFRARQRHLLDTRVSCNSSQYPPTAITLSRRPPRTLSRLLPPTSTFFGPKPQPTVITPHLVRTAARKQYSTHYGRIRFKAAVFDLGEEGDPNPDSGTCKRRHTSDNLDAEVLIADVGQRRQDDAFVQTQGMLASGGSGRSYEVEDMWMETRQPIHMELMC